MHNILIDGVFVHVAGLIHPVPPLPLAKERVHVVSCNCNTDWVLDLHKTHLHTHRKVQMFVQLRKTGVAVRILSARKNVPFRNRILDVCAHTS